VDRVNELKESILAQVAEYYRLVHAKEEPFDEASSRVNYAGRVFDEREMINLAEASLEFWLTAGKWAARFEKGLAEYLGCRHALLVNSGSSANLLALMALTSPLLGERRLRRGDEVITVAAGFPTTVAPAVQYGAVPVFVDTDLQGNIDPALLEQALSPRTRAVMAAHTLGNPFRADLVRAFCDRHGLWLIEDNCDSLGSKLQGRFTGTFGDIGTSSFYPPHHLTMGEGGAVYTSDALLRKIMLSMRDWGRDCWCEPGCDNSCGCRFSRQFGELPPGYDHKYVYSHFGYNLKATDLQAAVGCAQLEKLTQFTARRRENFDRLREGLRDLEEFLILPEAAPDSEPSWFGFLMMLRHGKRNEFARCLEDNRIQTRNLFGGNLTRQPCFGALEKGREYRIVGELKNTDRIMNDSLWVGVYPGMTAQKIDYMIRVIRRCFLT
jgi:CDP-6-deoxy-D-xylo-4-hexulose-3-dehydrase